MSDHSRIDDLRRRVEADPTSIAFAALAEEYRRAGQYEDAAAVCRSGLTRHPAYLSARVTLGRALLELNDLDAAQAELEQVLKIAPENLAATRALSDVHERRDGPRPAVAAPIGVPSSANVIPFELDLMPAAAAKTADRPVVAPAVVELSLPSPVLASLDRFLDAIVTLKRISA